MGLHRFRPPPSGRMGVFWTLSGIKDAAVIEFGCMGHNLYGGSALKRAGIHEGSGADLYTTHIDETDISLGDTSRLYDTIGHVVREVRPKAIFLQPSAVPEVIGTDLLALVNIMQRDFPGTPLIPAGRGSFAISARASPMYIFASGAHFSIKVNIGSSPSSSGIDSLTTAGLISKKSHVCPSFAKHAAVPTPKPKEAIDQSSFTSSNG